MGNPAVRRSGSQIQRLILLVALLWAALLTMPAFAWGAYGHRTVAAIAMANVRPVTAARIRRLMQAAPELETAKCKLRDGIIGAASWPDCLYGDKANWGSTFTWHYVNVPVCGAFDIPANCPDGICVVTEIERNRRILADRNQSAKARLQALIFVVHLVGDVHQPLHVGENGDQGGNKIKAQYGIVPGRNLHSIWDTANAERAISSASPGLVRRYSPAERARLGGGTPESWARESWALSKDWVYPTAFGKLPCDGKEQAAIVWNEAAIEASVPIIDQRIEQAGLRLARMLDGVLGGRGHDDFHFGRRSHLGRPGDSSGGRVSNNPVPLR